MIVTISREYGAAGLAVADGVARALQYDLLTDVLPEIVAARLGITKEQVAERASSDPPFAERALGGLELATPESVSSRNRGTLDPFDEDVRREIERTIRERAAEGDVVILGRLANAVLAGTPGLLRVFLTAPPAWRVERLTEAFGFSRERAASELGRVDAWRRKYARERFGLAWGDARHYDLSLDTSRFGIEGTVELIAAAARAAL